MTEVINTYKANNVPATAERMLKMYQNSYRYTAYDRAVDHAQSYSSASYNYKYWMDVAAEILRLQREKTSKDL